jgi:hypothetical protein
MARRSPFKHPGPGRPKLSPAAKKRAQKFKLLAEKMRKMRQAADGARYCIVTAAGAVWKTFVEFSGWGGAKEALDMSDLSPGAAIIRVCDGIELAHRSGQVNASF